MSFTAIPVFPVFPVSPVFQPWDASNTRKVYDDMHDIALQPNVCGIGKSTTIDSAFNETSI